MAQEAYPDALPARYTLHWYVVERVLGQGGFGITYVARDTNLDQLVAVKEYLPAEVATRRPDNTVRSRTDDLRDRYRAGLERFIREARTLARFDHPNIVRVHSVFEFNGTAYMVMRFEEGENFAHLLERRGTLKEDELLRIVLPILDGLELVHNAGFIHRDIKPDNIHIRADGTPVLLDFGSARHALGRAQTLTILIAPGYAPFEQYYSDSEGQGPWTDIYGLGATCYRAISGTAPLDAITRSKGILGSTREVLVPAKNVGSGRYSPRLLAAIDDALQFAEKDRPQTIAQWRNQLIGEDEATNLASAKSVPPKQSGAFEKMVAVAPALPPETVDSNLSAPANAVSLNQSTTSSKVPARVPMRAAILAIGSAAVAAIVTTVLFRIQNADRNPQPDITTTREQIAQEFKRLEEARRTEEEKKRLEEQRQAQLAERQKVAEQNKVAEQKARQDEEERLRLAEQKQRDKEKGRQLAEKRAAIERREAKNSKERSVAGEVVISKGALPVAPTASLPSVAPTSPGEPEPAAVPPKVVTAKVQEAPVVAPAPPTAAEHLASAERAEASGDFGGAIAIVKPLADSGNAKAQTKLGDMYTAGRGVTRDYGVAFIWYHKAADQGDALAYVKLGQMYANGRGVPKNYNQAYIWYSLAARAGNASAEADRQKMAALLQPAEVRQADKIVDSKQGHSVRGH